MNDSAQSSSHPKIKAKVLKKFHGLTIYGKLVMPKRRGKARVLIQIRQATTGDLRIAQCLSYTRSVDILFETETSRNSEGLIV